MLHIEEWKPTARSVFVQQWTCPRCEGGNKDRCPGRLSAVTKRTDTPIPGPASAGLATDPETGCPTRVPLARPPDRDLYDGL